MLTGVKPLVLDGHTADWALVAARTEEGLGTFLLQAPACELVPTLDPTRKAARLVLEETPVEPVGFVGLVEALQSRWTAIAHRFPKVEDIRVIGIDLTKRRDRRPVTTKNA